MTHHHKSFGVLSIGLPPLVYLPSNSRECSRSIWGTGFPSVLMPLIVNLNYEVVSISLYLSIAF